MIQSFDINFLNSFGVKDNYALNAIASIIIQEEKKKLKINDKLFCDNFISSFYTIFRALILNRASLIIIILYRNKNYTIDSFLDFKCNFFPLASKNMNKTCGGIVNLVLARTMRPSTHFLVSTRAVYITCINAYFALTHDKYCF